MAQHVLFVCVANVCRSPLMAATLIEAVGDDESWDIDSRGISVVRRQPMCRLGVSLLEGDARAMAYGAAHVATPLDESALRGSGLVIVASREERARTARMLPSSRDRTFTLREAISLGRPELGSSELSHPRREDGDPPSVRDYAELLHHRRGRVPVESSRRRVFPWGERTHPLDIPDAHHDAQKTHLRTLKETRALVAELHRQLAAFLDLRSTAASR